MATMKRTRKPTARPAGTLCTTRACYVDTHATTCTRCHDAIPAGAARHSAMSFGANILIKNFCCRCVAWPKGAVSAAFGRGR